MSISDTQSLPPSASASTSTSTSTSNSKLKPEIPWAFIDCPTDDLIVLISHMLELLIQHNDQVELTPDALTRFHSRAAPGISVIEYLRRIVKYTNMEKIPLLSLLAYIDITCQHLPTFTLSSLTVHRFLIAGVCAGSKAQCDVFCTNGHYAKVGGIKVQELNSLERELLKVTEWALCCNADLLQQYYTSLIKSHGGYTQAPAPSQIPFRSFPRSTSKPPGKAASPEDERREASEGVSFDQPMSNDSVAERNGGVDEDMDGDSSRVSHHTPAEVLAAPDIMDVDPPDRPISPNSDAGSSSLPPSSRSSPQILKVPRDQVKPPHPSSSNPQQPPTLNANGSEGQGQPQAGAMAIDGDEEMLSAAPPVPTPNPPSKSISPPPKDHPHQHHIHAPKVIKHLVGGIFHHKKHEEPHDHPPSDSLPHLDRVNGLEQSRPARPTHPPGKDEPIQPSSMIPIPNTTSNSPRLTARLPHSPRLPQAPDAALSSRSTRSNAAGGDVPMTSVTPKIRSRDERSSESLRDEARLSGVNSTIGAVGGDENKRRAL